MQILRIQPTIKHYAWGSRTFLPELLGRSPDGAPWAELWVGTHPGGPSVVPLEEGPRPLDEILRIHEYPGIPDGDLPFLCKILAIDAPLSIQCHPTREQAEEGFLREEGLGIPIDASRRNYKDRNHKPEIICALTPMIALSGLREPQEIVAGFAQLDSPFFDQELRPLLIGETRPSSERLHHFVMTILRLEGVPRARFVEEVRAGLEALGTRGTDSPEIELMRRLTHHHPDDPAICAPLYLRLYTLAPGEALYQHAGVLHAYMYGVGLELMANSDNVLRGGLTPKHIDQDELEKVVFWEPSQYRTVEPQMTAPGTAVYPSPSTEFELTRCTLDQQRFSLVVTATPVFLLCVSGSCEILRVTPQFLPDSAHSRAPSSSESTRVAKGEVVCMLPSGPHTTMELRGEGVVFFAGIPGSLILEGVRG